MIFNKWDNQKKKIQINTETPFICENNIKEDNKKCYKFYENIEDNESIKKIFICPYGLCAFKTENNIYTCLNIEGKADLTKLVPNLKRYKQNPKQFTQYTVSQIAKTIEEYEKLIYETQVRRITIHDIKNATKHFIDLVDDVKSDEEVIRIAESNDKLFSSVEGYSLIQYRLAYHDKLLNYQVENVDMAYINFHQALKKLSKILMYRGIKKGVNIQFHGFWKTSFQANKDLYIMYFILLENALKYAIENTDVDVDFAKTEEHELVVSISNQCYYIDEDEITNIFISGFRGQSAIKTTKGSGLGLGIAKKIADVSNVEIECKYEMVNLERGKFIVKCIHKKRDHWQCH